MFKQLFFSTLIIIFILSCGSNNNLSVERKIDSNQIIDIDESLSLIQRELADKYIESYISKDKKDIFTTIVDNVNLYEKTYSLLHYDSIHRPLKLKSIIIDHSDKEIANVYLLKDNKIVVLVRNYYYIQIKIFDYAKNSRIRTYKFDDTTNKRENFQFVFDEEENYIYFQDTIIDISDIYQNPTIPSLKLYRDDLKNVVIDPVNHLIWQDDNDSATYTYDYMSAIEYCENKPGRNWHLPTLQEFYTITKELDKPFISPPFKNTERSHLWIFSPTTTKNRNRNWTYNLYDFSFEYKEQYDNHVICVADL